MLEIWQRESQAPLPLFDRSLSFRLAPVSHIDRPKIFEAMVVV